MSATRLAFSDLRRRFGRLSVLRGVSGEVAPGEVLLVTGANGAGKSTLLRCLAALLLPEKGAIEHVEEGRLLSPAERRRRVGFLAPDLSFYEELTTLENLQFFARLRGWSGDGATARAREMLARVGLTPARQAGALSSGMRQRLRWAWALLHQPRVLLLDEPFQNLDAPGEEAVRTLLGEHLAFGLAVVASPGPLEIPGIVSHLDLASPLDVASPLDLHA